jgi:hypothetical protein
MIISPLVLDKVKYGPPYEPPPESYEWTGEIVDLTWKPSEKFRYAVDGFNSRQSRNWILLATEYGYLVFSPDNLKKIWSSNRRYCAVAGMQAGFAGCGVEKSEGMMRFTKIGRNLM